MQSDKEMLEWVQFVTDRFAGNHEPWKYQGDTSSLKHIRYVKDNEGWYHWKKRLKRFWRNITVRRWKVDNSVFGVHMKELPYWQHVKVQWQVQMKLNDNLPDAMVNGNIFHWDEDAEYVTMFCPYVGREVLAFLNAEPDNPYARKIINAMQEVSELSWPSEKEGN